MNAQVWRTHAQDSDKVSPLPVFSLLIVAGALLFLLVSLVVLALGCQGFAAKARSTIRTWVSHL